MKGRWCFAVLVSCLLGACATGERKPELPYPAFVDTAEIEEQFLAALPGVRARVYRSDMRTRTMAARVDIPMDWKGTTGGEPGKALEIFVLDGEVRFSDISLGPGGYAFVPPGSLGFSMASDIGAQLLYFVEEIDDSAVIRSPIILDSGLLEWTPTDPGLAERELRHDPGSGARTWLLKLEAGASPPWRMSNVVREGYLVSGALRESECIDGVVATWDYLPGGYFQRPRHTASGGPDALAAAESVWLLRETEAGRHETLQNCAP